MLSKAVLAVVLTLGFASPALAVGSSSSSKSPYPSQSSDYQKAVKAVKSGEYQQALTLLETVVQKEPKNADAWNYMGFSHRKLKHFDESLAAYEKALAIDPTHRGANEYLGELYLQTGNLPKAREHLDKLGKLCPNGCEEYRDLKEAIKAYESAHKSG